MKLARFRLAGTEGPARAGLVGASVVLDLSRRWERDGHPDFAADLVSILISPAREDCARIAEELATDPTPDPREGRYAICEVEFLAPVPRPGTFRDFYSFEEHVRRARARRGLEVPPEWYLRPVFYFSNPNSILDPGATVAPPPGSEKLDYELEIGCVIGRAGINLTLEQAADAIAGFTLLNDWSARDLQAEEVRIGLGPSKGKDFATSLGPWLVTPDELAPRRAGKGYDLTLAIRRGGAPVNEGNWKSIAWSFEEMIVHASRGARLDPGDLLGSGTVGGGCILEIGEEAAGGWLRPGDRIELEGGPLGRLENPVGPGPSIRTSH